MNILALDPGYGNTKVCINGQTGLIQTAISRPTEIGNAAKGFRVVAKPKIIEFENQKFAIGSGSWHWGTPISSKDFTALSTPENFALFLGAISEILDPGEYIFDAMALGLPVPLMQKEEESKNILKDLKFYNDLEMTFMLNGSTYHIKLPKIKILPQPVGAYMDWLISDDFKIRKTTAMDQIAILDIGMNTLDLFVIENGKVSPRYMGGSKVGMRRLIELINTDKRDAEEMDEHIRKGHLKPTNVQLNEWLSQILGVVETIWPRLSRFTAVIPTGGGALTLGHFLDQALIVKGAALYKPDDPVLSNVKGFWKWRQHTYAKKR